jgi:hypothetical protein
MSYAISTKDTIPSIEFAHHWETVHETKHSVKQVAAIVLRAANNHSPHLLQSMTDPDTTVQVTKGLHQRLELAPVESRSGSLFHCSVAIDHPDYHRESLHVEVATLGDKENGKLKVVQVTHSVKTDWYSKGIHSIFIDHEGGTTLNLKEQYLELQMNRGRAALTALSKKVIKKDLSKPLIPAGQIIPTVGKKREREDHELARPTKRSKPSGEKIT